MRSPAEDRRGRKSAGRILRSSLLLASLLALPPLTAAAATYSVPGYTDTAVVMGLTQPTDFTWTPDGRMLILERAGRVRIVIGGVLQGTAALDHTALTEDGPSETGFLGIALHPNFATTGELYIFYTRNSACPISGTPNRCNRLSKFVMTGDTISAASEVVILNNISAANGNHNGGTVLIGPDGKLWIAPGDSGTGGAKAQDLDPNEEGSFSGKVLRMELDGSPAAGNPYIGDVTKEQRIWAYGFRNPFRFSFRASNGALFAGDVGQGAREEVDAVTVSGGNYGWPMMEGNAVFQGPSCGLPTCQPPVFDYMRAPGGGAITGGVFIPGNNYPGLNGAYVFADYVQSIIRYAHIDANNVLVGTLQDLATSAGSPVAFKIGPDGLLYYVAYFTGRVYRINPPPAAQFHTLPLCRAADTRNAAGPYGGPALAANTTRTFTMAGRCGIPATAKAVSLNVTVTQPGALGDLRLFPAGATPPGTSTINFSPGQTRANNALLPVSTAGDLSVRCVMPSGTVHLILDVNGYME